MVNKKNLAIGTLVAGAAGYVAGVLTAPKSGRETRKDIRRKAAQAKSEAEHTLKDAHSELHKLIDEANAKVKAGTAKASKEYKEAVDRASEAKQKAKNVLSAIHEGEAEDKDLQKAVKETKQAFTHLKKYLGKK